jgi:hypothetical protein
MNPPETRIARALERLAEEERIAFTTPKTALYVARALAAQIDDDGPVPTDWGAEELGEWLLGRPEVAEVFDDDDALFDAYVAAFEATGDDEGEDEAAAVSPSPNAPLAPGRDLAAALGVRPKAATAAVGPSLVHPFFGALVYVPNNYAFEAHITDPHHGPLDVSIDPFSYLHFPHPPVESLLAEIEAKLDGAADCARASLARWDAVTGEAAEQLLGTYNGTWRTYDEDGETVVRPELDAAAFIKHLRLVSLTIRLPIGPESRFNSGMWIDVGDLFWGHALDVALDDDRIDVALAG